MRLDLACGPQPKAGFEGVDIRPAKHVQWVVDLEAHPWPWETGSVDEVWCSHYVEHVHDLVAFADDLWRILRPGGKATIIHPYAHSNRAWQDPTHVRALNEASWLYWNAEWRAGAGVRHVMICDFRVAIQPIWAPGWVTAEISDEARQQAMARLVNVVDDLFVTLTKLPDGRPRG